MMETTIKTPVVADPEWIIILGLIAFTIQLLRLSIDLIQMISNYEAAKGGTGTSSKKSSTTTVASSDGISTLTMGSGSVTTSNDSGSTSNITNAINNNNNNNNNNNSNYGSISNTDEEGQPLLSSSSSNNSARKREWSKIITPKQRNICFSICWTILLFIFLIPSINKSSTFPNSLLLLSTATIALELYLLLIDWKRCRYGSVQRFFHWSASLILWIDYAIIWINNSNHQITSNILVAAATVNVILTVTESWLTPHHIKDDSKCNKKDGESTGKKRLPMSAIIVLVKPYIWPDATDCSAFYNRVRAIMTWVCVIASKFCGLISPLYLGWASTALAHQNYILCIEYSIWYSVISWLGTTFKEGQSLVYLTVAQAAFIQLSENAFQHLHSLSLDWHLRKKLGEVLRSMDRGIAACDTLMKYLFLWLVPAIIECIVVCIIFATYFKYLPLAVTVFYFVFTYIIWTILVTVWRKKFRKALVKHDNEWHDRFTDSLINFETVKMFTAENYEMERFADAVSRYQTGSVQVQGSLSFLNISQQIILKICLALALSLAALGIQKRIDCCTSQIIGCDSGISECCQNISIQICPGMQVGDFVAVLTYTLNLFAPLNFLGSVYNAIVMAVIDLGSMSELLAETPDVVDAIDAIELPKENNTNPDISVEFDNVYFHYPTQSDNMGLQGLSFKMKRGTTTAIVGPTGAGKTTVSRLFFRFYDVLGGAVKVNGIDVRSVTQRSLRGVIGVVPQAANMFNDTIRNNILYGKPNATEDELIQVAKDAQILNFIKTLPEGWNTMVGDNGLKLSGGEKQRTAIARCLLKNPPFVLLDEATSALDSLTESSVSEALDRLGKQRTVLVIAHRLGTIRNADNIIVLKDGTVAEQGTHDELLEKDGIYADMWNMQLHSNNGSSI